MLLEISCDVPKFMSFLDEAEAQGVKPDFSMHGADENSSFSSVPGDNIPEISEEDLNENEVYIHQEASKNDE